jgi:hypothetical protein
MSHIIVVTTRSPRVEVDDVGKSVPKLDCWLGKSRQALESCW